MGVERLNNPDVGQKCQAPNRIEDAIQIACHWLFQHAPPVRCVSLGGSRARGEARPGSDLDIFVFTEDDIFHNFVRRFPQIMAEGLGPLFAIRPPTLTRGFGFQYSVFSETLGALDYFLVAPFAIQPFDRFKQHKVVFDHNGFFENKIREEERSKSDFSTNDVLRYFEFRLSSLYAETKRNIQKGESFQAQQALLELRSFTYGVIKTLISGELFDYTTKAKRGDKKTSTYYDKLNACVSVPGIASPSDCAEAIIAILIEAMLASKIVSADANRTFVERFRKMVSAEIS